MLELINSIWTFSAFPLVRKTVRFVPIHKCNIVNGLDDIRPISILPMLSKVCEHIMKEEQILRHTCTNIYNGQFAFLAASAFDRLH